MVARLAYDLKKLPSEILAEAEDHPVLFSALTDYLGWLASELAKNT